MHSHNVPAVIAVCMLSGGCALNPYSVQDPTHALGIGPRVPDVVKSLRCEIVSFLVGNRLRSAIQSAARKTIQVDYVNNPELFAKKKGIIDSHPAINTIDARQFAAVLVDFKNINVATLAVGFDWDGPGPADAPAVKNHVGGGYTDTRTFQLTHPMLIAQNADLGPAKSYTTGGATTPLAAAFTSAYNGQPMVDEEFYCYKSLVNSTSSTIEDASTDIQSLLIGTDGWGGLANFTRIMVGQNTLAEWLQIKSVEINMNEQTIFPTSENALLGQLNYSFILSAKPALDYKYVFVASWINPFAGSAAASIDHQSTFTIWLNTIYAVDSLAARQGNARIDD